MVLTLTQLLEIIEGQPTNKNIIFNGVAPLSFAQKEHISFLMDNKYLEEARSCSAGALLCTPQHAQELHGFAGIICICENPYAAFAKVSQYFFKPKHPYAGIPPGASVDESAVLGNGVTIFPFAFIGPGARIGAGTVVYSGCFIGAGSVLGENCILYPNVVVREGCAIGNNCTLQPGAVLGGDGFGFAPTDHENVKIPHIGGIQIGNDVEIGSNATIDRGTMSNTTIGNGTKIDNLVMLAHNVQVGNLTLIAAQSGIAGSSKLGNKCVLAGQIGIVGHLNIGDNVTLTAKSAVTKNISTGGVWRGHPALPYHESMRIQAALNKMAKEYLNKHSKKDPKHE